MISGGQMLKSASFSKERFNQKYIRRNIQSTLHVGLQIYIYMYDIYVLDIKWTKKMFAFHFHPFFIPHSSATAWQREIKAKRLKGLMRDPIFAKVAFRLKRQRCEGWRGRMGCVEWAGGDHISKYSDSCRTIIELMYLILWYFTKKGKIYYINYYI